MAVRRSARTDAAIAIPLVALAAIALADRSEARRPRPLDGKALIERFECARCHDGLPGRAFPDDKHCVRCHRAILDGKFTAPEEALARWREHLRSLNAVPTLRAAGELLRRDWVRAFLEKPHKVRPELPASMPRLRLGPAEAAAIATALVPAEAAPVPVDPALLDEGRALYRRLRCAACHRFTGSSLDEPSPAGDLSAPATPARALSPDLAEARDRVQPGRLRAWLAHPQALRPDTLMPEYPLAAREIDALASAVTLEPLAPAAPPPAPTRLPVLTRRVAWDEVNEQVFRRTCWHCHAQPDYALGDGGPGNTGGFGAPPRGLDLSTATGASSGSLGDDGRRASVFRPEPDGTPRLLAHLLARQREARGEIVPGLYGMPLGLPPLTPGQIQLVESWIAQGRPR